MKGEGSMDRWDLIIAPIGAMPMMLLALALRHL
jgi:hypothetical protein